MHHLDTRTRQDEKGGSLLGVDEKAVGGVRRDVDGLLRVEADAGGEIPT